MIYFNQIFHIPLYLVKLRFLLSVYLFDIVVCVVIAVFVFVSIVVVVVVRLLLLVCLAVLGFLGLGFLLEGVG